MVLVAKTHTYLCHHLSVMFGASIRLFACSVCSPDMPPGCGRSLYNTRLHGIPRPAECVSEKRGGVRSRGDPTSGVATQRLRWDLMDLSWVACVRLAPHTLSSTSFIFSTSSAFHSPAPHTNASLGISWISRSSTCMPHRLFIRHQRLVISW